MSEFKKTQKERDYLEGRRLYRVKKEEVSTKKKETLAKDLAFKSCKNIFSHTLTREAQCKIGVLDSYEKDKKK